MSLGKGSFIKVRVLANIYLSRKYFHLKSVVCNGDVCSGTQNHICLGSTWNGSKSAQSGLVLPAGAVHRWMLDSSVARVVSECASLYLWAVVELLAKEIYRRVVLEPN